MSCLAPSSEHRDVQSASSSNSSRLRCPHFQSTHTHTHTHDGLSRRGRRIATSSVRLAMGKQTNARGAWSAADVASPHHRYDTRCYFNVRSKADISQLNLPHASSSLLQQQGPSWPSAWRQDLLCATPPKPIWHLSSTVSRHSCQGVQSATRKEPDRMLVG